MKKMLKKSVAIMLMLVMTLTIAPLALASGAQYIVTTVLAPSMVFDDVYVRADFTVLVSTGGSIQPPGVATEGGRVGVNDGRTGTSVMSIEFESIIFTGDFFIARQNRLSGVFNLSGVNIIPMIYESLFYDPDSGLFIAFRDGVWGTVDLNGVFTPTPTTTTSFINRMYNFTPLVRMYPIADDETNNDDVDTTAAPDADNSSYGLDVSNYSLDLNENSTDDLNGNLPYYTANPYDDDNEPQAQAEHYAATSTGWNFDTTPYTWVQGFPRWSPDGTFRWALVSRDGMQGLLNLDGSTLIPIEFDEIQQLGENAFTVRQGEKWGAFDLNGTGRLPVVYDSIWLDYQNQVIVVSRDGQYGTLDLGFQTLVPPTHGNIALPSIRSNYVMVSNGTSWGVVNRSGEQVVPFIYQDIRFVGADRTGDFFWVRENNVWGIIRINQVNTEPITRIDEDTGITLFAPAGTVPTDTVLQVRIITEGAAGFSTANTAMGEVANRFVAFDIKLISGGREIQPNGNVRITIPGALWEEYLNKDVYDRLAIYHVAPDGNETLVLWPATPDANGNIAFETDRFSIFTNAELTNAQLARLRAGPQVQGVTNVPQTGDDANSMLWISLLSISLLGIALAIVWHKKRLHNKS